MTDVMSQAQWGIPSSPADPEQATATAKRPLSPNASDNPCFKSQRSISDVLGPKIEQVNLADGQATGTEAEGEPTVDPALLTAADALLNSEDQDETDGHRVKNLIRWFEPSDQNRPVDEDVITQEEESILHIPQKVLSKTADGVQGFFQAIGDTVVEGVKEVVDGVKEVKDGVKTIANEMKKVIDKFDLPKCAMEERPAQNNIHVPHPDKFRGSGMIGLGMNIQKDKRGHVVRSIVPGGVAEKSKVQNNDIVISVNDNDVRDLEFDDLQHFFGSFQKTEFKIVVEREALDEGGNSVSKTITTTIKLNLEDNKVTVNVAIVVTAYPVHFVNESKPYYITQNDNTSTTKFLTIKDDLFCMSIAPDLTSGTKCQCKFLSYVPSYHGPTVIFNVSENYPLDLGMPTGVGADDVSLRNSSHQHDFSNDTRFFFMQKQKATGKTVFEMTSRNGHFLTVDSNNKLTSTDYKNIKDVEFHGLFDVLKEEDFIWNPPSINEQRKDKMNIKGNAFGLQKGGKNSVFSK